MHYEKGGGVCSTASQRSYTTTDNRRFFTKCGTYDKRHGVITVYDDNSKRRIANRKLKDEDALGFIVAASDCVVTDVSIISPGRSQVETDKSIVTVSRQDGLKGTSLPAELVTRPSETIERCIKSSAAAVKGEVIKTYVAGNNQKVSVADRCRVPLSTVGVKLRLCQGVENRDVDAIIYNKSSASVFNIFNSHRLFFEVHTDFDIVLLLTSFLKYNSVFGGQHIDLYNFNYHDLFFVEADRGNCVNSSFVRERAKLIALVAADDQRSRKRKFTPMRRCGDGDDDFIAASKRVVEYKDGDEAMEDDYSFFDKQEPGCCHDMVKYGIELPDCGRDKYCLACFCNFFFVCENSDKQRNSFVHVKDMEGITNWIQTTMSSTRKITPVDKAAVDRIVKKMASMDPLRYSREAIIWNTCMLFDRLRCGGDGDVDFGLLFRLMNPFGKMMLLFISNMLIMTNGRTRTTPSPGGRAEGTWFDVEYYGVNLWSFQFTRCKIEKNKKMCDLAAIETLRRLPSNPDTDPCCARMVFGAYCRGEGLSSPGGILSDVTHATKNIKLRVENRVFGPGGVSRSLVSEEPLVGLEITGYRPNRAQNTKNYGRVSPRILRILGARDGSRAWVYDGDALILEDVAHDEKGSEDAMERAAGVHKVFYYDIETTSKSCSDPSALITSICGSMCVGGETERGERAVFGLAAQGVKPPELTRAIEELYPNGHVSKDEFAASFGEDEEYVVTDYPPERIYTFTSEFELLRAFCDYMARERPHVISGWNNREFDDPFVFYRLAYNLSHEYEGRDASRKMDLAASASVGTFDLLPFMNPRTGSLEAGVWADIKSRAKVHDNASFSETTAVFQDLVGGTAAVIRFDLEGVLRKAYGESLSHFSLDAVLAKVSKLGDRQRQKKDPVDVAYHLLGYMELKDVKEQATVQKYCSKDAYLVAVVASATGKEKEMFRLSFDSNLPAAVVAANMPTPLCISEGAINRSMGKDRSVRRGCGIRRHSMATETKGGMVAEPIVNSIPLQTMDMSSLYPAIMRQNNLCTSTFATHRQVLNLRDRLVLSYRESDTSLLAKIDRANRAIFEQYMPVDIVVKSWVIKRGVENTAQRTLLEHRLGKRFITADKKEWCFNKPPNASIASLGLDYFPEYSCNSQTQMVAKVNDDTHVAVTGLEYLLQAIVVMAIEDIGFVEHITAGTISTLDAFLDALEADFDRETDERIKREYYSFAGTPLSGHRAVNRVRDRMMGFGGGGGGGGSSSTRDRVVAITDRILRRVNRFDSADDEAVRLWSYRLINVGSYFRTWTIRYKYVPGVIPDMQARYKATRAIMQKDAKEYAVSDPKRAEFNKVGEKTCKLAMNSIYGCLSLKVNTANKTVSANATSAVEGGVGGGTRHSPSGNQITDIARRGFVNIVNTIEMTMGDVKQVYGDTDSVFCSHNIPGDGYRPEIDPLTGKIVYMVDMLLKDKLARFLPLLVNATTKGIFYDERTDAGLPFMKIAHERLCFITFLLAKKTYHLLHLKEGSPAADKMVEMAASGSDGEGLVDKFVRRVACPVEWRGHVIPHNVNVILKAAARDDTLRAFLRKEGVVDAESMREWFTVSDHWLSLDADTMYNLYASTMVEVNKEDWIDWKTGNRLVDADAVEAVRQANGAFVLYKKGAFVKKGISAFTKLKGVQSLFVRALPLSSEKKRLVYRETIMNHVRKCAAFLTDPSMIVTTVKCNKFIEGAPQKLPNPMAMMVNNRLNSSTFPIRTASKFNTVPSVSAWFLSLQNRSDGGLPDGYFDNKTQRWDFCNMRGVVSCSTVKNLSVVPNNIRMLMEMIKSDLKTTDTVIGAVVSALVTSTQGTGGALKRGALCLSNGMILADSLARAIVTGTTDVSSDSPRDAAEATEDDEDIEQVVARIENKKSDDIVGRLVRTMSLDRLGGGEFGVNSSLKSILVDRIRVDERVYDQLVLMVEQQAVIRQLVDKKKKRKKNGSAVRTNDIEEIISEVDIDILEVAKVCADRTRKHCRSCPVIIPEDDGKNDLCKALELLSGKTRCVVNCTFASCQAMDFVLLSTLALRVVNRLRMEGKPLGCYFPSDWDVENDMREAKRTEIVKRVFPDRYNSDMDAVVYLFEPNLKKDRPIGNMTKNDFMTCASKLSFSDNTGQIWNPADEKYFGKPPDAEEAMACLSRTGKAPELPFTAGLFFKEPLELAAVCLARYIRPV